MVSKIITYQVKSIMHEPTVTIFGDIFLQFTWLLFKLLKTEIFIEVM